MSQEERNTQAQVREWQRNIPLDPVTANKLYVRLGGFFQQALKLVAMEPGVTQEVITALASEGGLVRIRELVDCPFDEWSDAVVARYFRGSVVPFFQLLCHKNVERSALLEARVAGIYTYLFGPTGQRAVILLTASAQYLATVSEKESKVDARVAFEAITAVFAKIMDINATAQLIEPLGAVADTVMAFIEPRSEHEEPISRLALRHVKNIQQRYRRGQHIPTAADQVHTNGDAPVFAVPLDRPGHLSDDGPRHDNDHASIKDIKILPTTAEIAASRNEYLPSLDPSEWHCDGVEGLLDRNFRLLREDTVGQLRDAAKFELEKLLNPVRKADDDKRFHGARTFVYRNVHFESAGFDFDHGLEFAISFDQPFNLQSRTCKESLQMWEDSKRLISHTLVCLVDTAGGARFFMVSAPPDPRRKKNPVSHMMHSMYPRSVTERRAQAVIRPVETRDDIAKDALFLLTQQYGSTSHYDGNAGFFHGQYALEMSLVEFPAILVPAFQPTLAALQNMSARLDMPFADVLVQDPADMPGNTDPGDVGGPTGLRCVPPPAYALANTFEFDLSAVSDSSMRLKLDVNGRPVEFDKEAFKRSTSLDAGQAEALIHSLCHCFAITQGPPGTGKSYTGIGLIKVLLDSKVEGDLGPIVLVSYTNHALDQLLEHLLDAKVNQIIRIGSRSQSKRLSNLNLRVVAKTFQSTKTEKKERYRLKKEVEAEGFQMAIILSELQNVGHQMSIEAYLLRTNPDYHRQLFTLVDESGFQIVDHHRRTVLVRWLNGILFPPGLQFAWAMRPLDELVFVDLRQMSLPERAAVYQYWIQDIRQDVTDRLTVSLRKYNELKARLDLIRTENELRALSKADVVGVTTSGLARNLTLLRKLPSKVLVSEEAGEVLESHLLTAMLPSLEHVILIGDHLQLRPQVQNYGLSSESVEGKQYCLDVSLFERLVKPLTTNSQPLPFSTLDVQRRMHPSISELVRSTLYPQLKDSPTVANHPEVSGMRHRLFWLHHKHRENAPRDNYDHQTTSKTNDWEGKMTAALVSHLVRQGLYKPSQIAVLTPYLGQLRVLRKDLKAFHEITLSEGDAIELGEAAVGDNDSDVSDDQEATTGVNFNSKIIRGTLMDAVRLSTIDNFQGEEAEVVIISLVRCNDQLKPGFLRTENRCNVLLSRAKHGMYIIGDSETAATVPMWAKVLDVLGPENLGQAIELCCPRHPEKFMEATEPEDIFRLAPAGGCEELCERQLPKCGHACPQHCHSDLAHEDVFCQKDCFRPLPGCDHPCPNRCGDSCPKRCEVRVLGWSRQLECGHTLIDPPCWQTQELEKFQCTKLVLRTIPGCEHKVEVPCHVDYCSVKFACPATCNCDLPCGHKCARKCSKCIKKRLSANNTPQSDTDQSEMNDSESETEQRHKIIVNHGECKTQCGRDYNLCRHSCRDRCHEDNPCGSCRQPCEVRCGHSKCSRSCSEPCVPCAEETCASQCEHASCNMPCAAPCDWVPCSKRCSKTLKCGCRCPTVCGEACPATDFCQNCGKPEILEQQVDFIEFTEYHDVDLDDNPVVILTCGHCFTISTLDGLMSMSDYYEIDDNGLPKSIKTTGASNFSKDELKSCPTCRGTLRNVARYGRIVRRALLDESTKKFITWSNREYVQLAQRLFDEQEGLRGSAAEAKALSKKMQLTGSCEKQIAEISNTQALPRYRSIFGARRMIIDFLARVTQTEQPFQRVRDMVEAVRRKRAGDGIELVPFDFDQSLLQTRAGLLAFALRLRCDLTIISDVLGVRDQTPTMPGEDTEVVLNFSENRIECEKLSNQAERSHQVLQQVEAHLFWARYAALELIFSPMIGGVTSDGENTTRSLRDEAEMHLVIAESICDANPAQTKSVDREIEPTREMLKRGVFYEHITSDEMRAVVAAMATEFGVTGHWYRCVNGHLFTIGECGGAMETARCPQCGAQVGGTDHTVARGVTRADDLEEEFEGLVV